MDTTEYLYYGQSKLTCWGCWPMGAGSSPGSRGPDLFIMAMAPWGYASITPTAWVMPAASDSKYNTAYESVGRAGGVMHISISVVNQITTSIRTRGTRRDSPFTMHAQTRKRIFVVLLERNGLTAVRFKVQFQTTDKIGDGSAFVSDCHRKWRLNTDNYTARREMHAPSVRSPHIVIFKTTRVNMITVGMGSGTLVV
ncbi:hypothetical protein EVAR_7398_1 [Eumeta japonica]|uniref:Uncharacterized protein n=1 Tax=Eumeta variegata TaxID=151549 RepID=A0A4C1V7B8_EUMVA|nr:hypothetical protein EVAR_7398_1 [Eumeta japonica]